MGLFDWICPKPRPNPEAELWKNKFHDAQAELATLHNEYEDLYNDRRDLLIKVTELERELDVVRLRGEEFCYQTSQKLKSTKTKRKRK